MTEPVTNVVIAGLGGQGVLTASDVLADAAFAAGLDVKKSEIHGMSRRGGPVTADVRFGRRVLSPLVPSGEIDFLVVLAEGEAGVHRDRLRPGGVLIPHDAVDPASLANRRSLNVALLGVLSRHLNIDEAAWRQAIRKNLKPPWHEANLRAFEIGRGAARVS